VRWPGRFQPVVDDVHLVSLTDIAPTILDIVGAKPLPDIDGRSFLPLVLDQEQPPAGDALPWRDVIVGTRYEDILRGVDTEEKRELRISEG